MNDFFEAKGPDGTQKVLDVQVVIDGALGARAMHYVRAYGQLDYVDPDGHARSFVTTYHARSLVVYGSHMHPKNEDATSTYVTRLRGGYGLGSADYLRKSISIYRNTVELA